MKALVAGGERGVPSLPSVSEALRWVAEWYMESRFSREGCAPHVSLVFSSAPRVFPTFLDTYLAFFDHHMQVNPIFGNFA